MKLLSTRTGWGLGVHLAITLLMASWTQPSLHAAELIPLRAGPVSMVFDAENVFLRYIRVGEHEVLRGINAPIRNENWATIAPRVSNLTLDQQDGSFHVTFDVACQRGEIDFRWKGTISGNDKGDIEFTFDGRAHSAFKKNRIGFCILHGPSASGQPWVLETVDGKTSRGQFPKRISPHQPAKNLKAITHQVAEGIRARVAFEGDVFEMEDQRNWTDASFKTYCTPLEIPYPVQLSKGAKITQKVSISIDGDISDVNSSSEPTVLTLTNRTSALPALGLQVSSEIETLTGKQIERLKALNLNHLQVDLSLSDRSFVKNLRRAAEQAKALGVSLQVILGLGDSPELATLANEVKAIRPPVSYWLVRGGDPADFTAAFKLLKPLAGEAKIGVTRVTNFVDLNRARPEDDSIEAFGFAINPQIHAFDNASIVETLPIHADVVNSTRAFAGDRPLVIGPITMAPQLLDGVDQPGGPPAGGPLPTYVDPRQIEPLTAAWTLGSLKYLAESGVHSATFFETVGWAGVMDADVASSRPEEFPSRPGQLFPVYQLLREVSEFKSHTVYRVDTSDNLSAVGLALHKRGQLRVLVGNLTGESQTITIRGLSGEAVDVQLLGSETIKSTPELSISLPPYGIGRIDRAAD